jgi:glycosyltransferase involved in cell wall biosynthesis
MKYKVAYLVSHPIQYQSPLLRRLAAQPWIELKVLYMTDFSLQGYVDDGFGRKLQWDIPLVGGFEHEVLPAKVPHQMIGPRTPVNLQVKERIQAGNYDALITHGYSHPTSIKAILAAKKSGAKVLVRAESQIGAVEGTGVKRKIKEAVVRALFRKVDAFLTVGTRNAAYYRSLGISPDKMFRVPYAVDNDFFRERAIEAHPNREELRASLGLEPGRPIFLFASKLLHWKRITDLFRAYSKLSEGGKEPHPYLVVVGDGEDMPWLKAEVEKSGWASVKLLGFRNQTELPALFDLCDVFVLPSHKEQWGLVVNEVMNVGKPVIVSTEVGSASDLVEDGVSGFIFEALNVDDLANIMRESVSDLPRLQRMGEVAKKKIANWSFEEDIEGIRQALEATLGKR